MKKFNYTYHTKLFVNGIEYNYVGVHSTDNLDDGYFGSGSFIKSLIKKKVQFDYSSEILEYFNTRLEAKQAEIILIAEAKTSLENCVNIADGDESGIGISSDIKESHKLYWADPKNKSYRSEIMKSAYASDEAREKMRILMKSHFDSHPEIKAKISASMKTSEHWKYFDELYQIWLKSERPKFKKFWNIISPMGYPKASYQKMVMEFNQKYEENI